MKIELYGAGSDNKGALLMIHAVLAAFEKRNIDAQFAVDPFENLSFDDRSELGIRYLPSLPSLMPTSRLRFYFRKILHRSTLFFDPMISVSQKKSLGLWSRSECDAFLDISGYRYGDFWHEHHSWAFKEIAKSYGKRKRPIILLPQMFGAFREAKKVNNLRVAFALADIIYARDSRSYDLLREGFDLGDKVRLCPDITIPIGSESVHEYSESSFGSRGVALVPNYRVYEKQEVGGAHYLRFLTEMYEHLAGLGYKPKFVIHEASGKDRQLAERVLASSSIADDGDIIHEDPCPLRTKKFLSSQQLVISSRYHATVSGLSSLVPVLTYGWAHKYQMLHRDFDCENWILDEKNPSRCAKKLIEEIFAEKQRFRTKLFRRRDSLVSDVESMWDEVIFKVLNLEEQ